MPSVYDTLYSWARKRTTSFAELRFVASERGPSSEAEGDALVYRLRTWPDWPAAIKTAGVLRTLSVMSHRPVNRSWLLSHSKLPARQIDRLLQRLVDEGAVEVIDTSKYGPDSH
ncbi:hypothetical protein [Caenimonas soli]|jgi:hypothetical protein|uniref:hypothetical protein n=1 Tax=Caenimonas soli TaxID=2735555 RepID=UPI001554A576|nr:hypothetical protein [Caenimonas soli]NPC57004.1 hypothetical protein [Caenimonas soli]